MFGVYMNGLFLAGLPGSEKNVLKKDFFCRSRYFLFGQGNYEKSQGKVEEFRNILKILKDF